MQFAHLAMVKSYRLCHKMIILFIFQTCVLIDVKMMANVSELLVNLSVCVIQDTQGKNVNQVTEDNIF